MKPAYRQINKSTSRKLYQWRYKVIVGILTAGVIALLGRMLILNIWESVFLRGQGDARTMRTVTMPAYRGMITDRNGYPLAISTPVDSVWVNPQEFNPADPKVPALTQLLGLQLTEVKERATRNASRGFMYLKRGLPPNVGLRVKNLHIHGVYLRREYRRFYPEGESAAHILGFTNIDDHGQEGLELAYDQWLGGTPGVKRVIQDRLGRVVSELGTVRVPHPGRDLTLSIDKRIQYLAYRELKAGAEKVGAVAATAIVLDLKTGEVLAMVNTPSFNPNSRGTGNADSSRYRNRAVTDLFEPGSTIKTFSMLSALSSGKFRPESKVDTTPGWLILDGKRVSDKRTVGVMDMATILKRSSNVGITKVILELPPDHLWNTLNAVGFGQLTGSNFPGEAQGVLTKKNPWRPFALATLSFGYGMSATILQVVQAYSILGNYGVKRPVSLLHVKEPPTGEQVVNAKAAKDILVMLESILAQGGTAPLARVPGYRVTGKTSTTRVVGANGYDPNRHNAGFTGLAPASQPRLLVTVFLHDLRGTTDISYYGGYTAGPIFARIMGESLRLLGVPSDEQAATLALSPNPSPASVRGEKDEGEEV